MRNAFTVDVEDYFQVSALAPYIPRDSWDGISSRVERNVDKLLALMSEHGVKATYFVLGWIAERYPEMVREILSEGHEIASHGFSHERASSQTKLEFRDDVLRAKNLLEDISGVEVIGYRAPSFSINQENLWAFQVLEETGYRYSSSIYPIRHDHYGMPDAPRFAFSPDFTKKMTELPPTTVRLLNRNLPAAGGGYFRLLPYPVSRWSIRRVNAVDLRPCIFYCHPWEIDPDQPRPADLDIKTRFRHYINLSRTERRLGRLMRDFEWGRLDSIFLEVHGAH